MGGDVSAYNYCKLDSNWWISAAPWPLFQYHCDSREQCFPNLKGTKEAACTEGGDSVSKACKQATRAHNRAKRRISVVNKKVLEARNNKYWRCKEDRHSSQCNTAKAMLTVARKDR